MVTAMHSPTVGVLALQGAFAKHLAMLQSLHFKTTSVRKPEDLLQCDALIIPGGESTTIARHIDEMGLRGSLLSFVEKKPVFGTCAGLILMAREVIDHSIQPFGLVDIVVERNGFGGQYASFTTETTIPFSRSTDAFHAVFIRAPRIKKCGTNVKVLATYQGEPILVQQNHFLAATFHPELTENPSIHRYFLDQVCFEI